jgi:hypothetical protein
MKIFSTLTLPTALLSFTLISVAAQAALAKKPTHHAVPTNTTSPVLTAPATAPASGLPPVTVVSPSHSSVQVIHEDWKGAPDPSGASFGGLAGLGVVDSSGGFAVLGTASTKIAKDGWLADVNESVSAEGAAGAVFFSGSSVFAYSLHLRWDFKKDETWTFYALGGVGGNIQGSDLGSHFELFPRFGVGTFYDAGLPFLIRGELSHELIAVGVNFPI